MRLGVPTKEAASSPFIKSNWPLQECVPSGPAQICSFVRRHLHDSYLLKSSLKPRFTVKMYALFLTVKFIPPPET
jgi:hypothetical protein